MGREKGLSILSFQQPAQYKEDPAEAPSSLFLSTYPRLAAGSIRIKDRVLILRILSAAFGCEAVLRRTGLGRNRSVGATEGSVDEYRIKLKGQYILDRGQRIINKSCPPKDCFARRESI